MSAASARSPVSVPVDMAAANTSLKVLLRGAIGALTLLALIASAALIGTTALLHSIVRQQGLMLEHVHEVEALEDELLRSDRETTLHYFGVKSNAPDTTLRSRVEARLADVRDDWTEPGARELVARTEREVGAYLDLRDGAAAGSGRTNPESFSRAMGQLDAALADAHKLVELGIRDADRAEERAARLDGISYVGGAVVTALILAIVFALAVLARRRLYAPLVEIRTAIGRFAAGDRSARSPEQGASELAAISHTFNEMAAMLDRQLSSVAAVAHDLRNPLSALKLGLASVSGATLPPEENIRRTAQLASRQVERLNRMIGDLLDTARIEAGRLELRMKDCDLREIVSDVVALFAPAAPGHRVTLSLPQAPVPVRCDAGRVEQALINLVSNAVKYSPEGGPVDIALEASASEASVTVRDRGVGIAPEELERIFEPFRRGETARSEIPGVGLGLSVTQRIMAAHGGRIEVESALGKGSTFRLRIPLAQAQPAT